MKPLLPSLKEKKRYVVFEIISEEKISSVPEKEIKEAFMQLFGEIGLGNAGLIFLRNKYSGTKGIIKVNNKCVDQLKASFCMVKNIGKNKVIIKSVGVSGTLKKAQEKYSG